MSLSTFPCLWFQSVLVISALLLTSCAGSDSEPVSSAGFESDTDSGADSNDLQPPINSGTSNGDGAGPITDAENPVVAIAGDTGSAPDDGSVSNPEQNTDSMISSPESLAEVSTEVTFNIMVPVHMSNSLQVRLLWGDSDFPASWVGDEIWLAVHEFPIDTENLLTVLFSDDNGGITLGSVELLFRTGANASETVQIAADQFDIERWDIDGDNVSNLDELIAGTDVFGPPRLLLFSETNGFRHDSIENALSALEELAVTGGLQTQRANVSTNIFTEENLANYAAVVWVLTSGDVLDASEQAAFEQYIRSGGGYAGIHAASDTEYDWPWYGNLVGAYFKSHPVIQTATQVVENSAHSSTAHLDETWVRTDEWYDFRSNPRAQVNVLLNLDEDTYSGGTMGDDHPIAWFQEYDGGRSWYTGGGHTNTSYSEPAFRAHLLGGLLYAAGLDK